MDHDFLPFDDLRTEFGDQLLPGGSPVKAGRDQNRHLDSRRAAPQPFQDLRHDDPARNRTGVVAGDHHRPPPSGGQLLQGRRTDRRVERLTDRPRPVFRRPRQCRFEGPQIVAFADPGRKPAPPVRKLNIDHVHGDFLFPFTLSHLR